MLRYNIYNGSGEVQGILSYDKDSDKYGITLPEKKASQLDICFQQWYRRGFTEVPEDLVMNWIDSRVIPSNRQGMKSILAEMGIEEYNLFDMLMYCDGRCQMDSAYIKQIDEGGSL